MCTNFLLPTDSGFVVSARSMDFEATATTDLFLYPVDGEFPLGPAPTNPLRWQNTYGFVAAGIVAITGEQRQTFDIPLLVDGMNQKGLSAAALWLPGSQFPADASTTTPNLFDTSLVAWALGTCATVDDIVTGLAAVNVLGVPFSDSELPFHFTFADATGATLVIEFVDGVMQATQGHPVTTNAPPIDWHEANLANYENLTVVNSPQQVYGQDLNGSGLRGLPGDGTPPSRFVRAATLRNGVFEPSSAQEAVGLAFQVLQNCAVPFGSIAPSATPTDVGDRTQWGVVRDHGNCVLYAFTAFNPTLLRIDLASLTFGRAIVFPLVQDQWFLDITEHFIG